MSPPVDRFAEHKEQVRRALIDAALDRFEREGFEATTVDDIAADAGVAPRTFFRYFPTKDAVLFPDKDDRAAEFDKALAERPADEPVLEALREVVLSLVDHVAEIGDVWHRRREVVRCSPILRGRELDGQQEFAAMIIDFAANRLGVDPDQDLRPRLIASTFMGALSAALDTWAAGGTNKSLRALVEEAFELLGDTTKRLG